MQQIELSGLNIGGIHIRQDAQGRFCLNDLHRAAGGENRHRPSLWLQNQQTQELIAELEKAGIPAIATKQRVGTFVVHELVYAYATWISPTFHVTVIRAYHALVTGNNLAPALNYPTEILELLGIARTMTDGAHAMLDHAKALNNIAAELATRFATLQPPTSKPTSPPQPVLTTAEKASIRPPTSTPSPQLSTTQEEKAASFVTTWYDCVDHRDMTASDLHRIINSQQCPALTQAAIALFGNLDTWTVHKLGPALKNWAEKSPVDGYLVLNLGKSKRGVVWRVERRM